VACGHKSQALDKCCTRLIRWHDDQDVAPWVTLRLKEFTPMKKNVDLNHGISPQENESLRATNRPRHLRLVQAMAR
jgi:hypothetical protein